MKQYQAQSQAFASRSLKPDPHAAMANLSQVSTVSASQATESSLASIAVTPTPCEIEDSYAVVREAAKTNFRRKKKPSSAPKQVPKKPKPPPNTPKSIESTASGVASMRSGEAASERKEKRPIRMQAIRIWKSSARMEEKNKLLATDRVRLPDPVQRHL